MILLVVINFVAVSLAWYFKEKIDRSQEIWSLCCQQQKKVELKETLLNELQDKKKVIESERTSMELTGGWCFFSLPSQSLLVLCYLKS